MTAKTKSIAIIIGTLVVGIIIGSLATGAIHSQRVAEFQALRNDTGLTRFLERVIEPTDEAQREQIRAILNASARQQLELRRSIVLEHRQLFEDLQEDLAEILTDEQKQQLRRWMEDERQRRRTTFSPDVMRRPEEGRLRRVPRDSAGRRIPPRRFRPPADSAGIP